jgi:hypothetical protein
MDGALTGPTGPTGPASIGAVGMTGPTGLTRPTGPAAGMSALGPTGPNVRQQVNWNAHAEPVIANILGEPNKTLLRPPSTRMRFFDNGLLVTNCREDGLGETYHWYNGKYHCGGGIKDLIHIYTPNETYDEAIAYAEECQRNFENGRKLRLRGSDRHDDPPLDNQLAPQPRISVYGKHSFYRDWECYSEVDIKQSGALYYAAHPTTVPLLVCYAVDDGPLQSYRPGSGEPIPEVFFTAANDPNWIVVAHNNLFDSAIKIYQAAPRFNWPLVPIERQVCTMALAVPRLSRCLGENCRSAQTAATQR